MPAVENEWLGDAQATRDKKVVRIANVGIGDYFYLESNRKRILAIAEAATATSVYALLAAQMSGGANVDETTPAEFLEMENGGNETDDTGEVTGMYVLGPTDGKPIQLTGSASDGEQPAVSVEVVTEGAPGTNEKQRVAFAQTAGSGTFTITYDGQTTGAIAYNASAYTVRDALCDLSNLAGTDEVQRLTSTATGGTFTITFEGQTTAAIAFNASAANIQSALEALSNIAVGDVVCAGGALNVAFVSITFRATLGRSNRTQVTCDNTNATGGTVVPTTTTAGVAAEVSVTGSSGNFVVEFIEGLANTDVDLMTADGGNLVRTVPSYGVSVTTLVQGTTGTNEIQFVRMLVAATGGTYTLTFDGQTTSNIAYNASAGTVQTALIALSNIAPGDVTVGGDYTTGFTVEFSGVYRSTNVSQLTGDGTNLTGGQTVNVATTTEGSPGVNCIVRVNLTGGGNFIKIKTTGFSSEVYVAWPAAATASDVVTQLVSAGAGLSSDFVVVAESITRWTIEFTGRFAGKDYSVSSTSEDNYIIPITTAAYTVAKVQDGDPTTADEVQLVTLTGGPTGGTFTLTYSGQTTAGVAYNASAATLQAALEALSNIAPGDVVVTGSAGGPWTVTFAGTLAALDVSQMTGSGASLTGGGFQVTTSQAATPYTNEQQRVSLYGTPAGGTFTLTFESNTTAGIAWNGAASAVQTALEALGTLGSGQVSVTGSAGGAWTVEFKGTRKGENVPQMTGSGASLSGISVTVGVDQEATLAENEVQDVTLTNNPTGGTFTLTFNSQTTSAIAYNATSAEVQAALEGLATPVPGDFAVSGSAGGPWTVIFTGAYASTDVSALTGSGASLTAVGDQTIEVADITSPTGPAWIDNADNWSQGHTPTTGEIWVFRNSARSALYGLENIDTEPAGIDVWSDFSGSIGLDEEEGDYREWRPLRLKVGTSAGSVPIVVRIGLGEGQGSSRMRFDFSDADVTLQVFATGQVTSGGRKALEVLASGGTNTATFQRGSVQLAVGSNQDSDWSTIKVGYLSSQDSDADVAIGDDVSIGSITQTGGRVVTESGLSGTWTMYGGEANLLGSASIVNLIAEGQSLFNWRSEGNCTGTAKLSGEAILNADLDLRATGKVFTNPIEVYGDGANVRDTYFVFSTNGTSPTGLVIDYNFTTRFPDLGSNVRITRAVPA